MLNSLYYPFSRCIEVGALKQLLLIFDSVTFIDPVDDDEWRAELFRNLERAQDPRFRAYRDLEGPLRTLRMEGVVALKAPSSLKSLQAPETAASAISDLQDVVFCSLAQKPAAFGLPRHLQAIPNQSGPSWEIFPAKLPPLFRELITTDERFRSHLLRSRGEDEAWTVTYEAGSAAALNLHLAACDELSLAPVTDSALHHRLLMRKMTRSITPEETWAVPASKAVEAVAHDTAVRLVEELIPRRSLERLSFEAIVRFREETAPARQAMVKELKRRLSASASMSSPSEIDAAHANVREGIARELREYHATLVGARERLWPGVVKATTSALTAGTAAGIALQLLVGGPFAVIAGSIGGSSLALLQVALEQRAETRKAQAAVGSTVAYLSRLSDLK